MTEAHERLPTFSVAIVSCGALANEILLTRLFAIVHWYHFAYMMISLALLGFGASGTFLALTHRGLERRFAVSFPMNLILFGVFSIVSPLAALAMPFHAEELLWDFRQPLWLAAIYLVLAVPFFCAANAIGLALMAHRAHVGRIYAADLIGAGLGSVLLLGLLFLAPVEHALKFVAAAGFGAALIAMRELRVSARGWIAGVAIAIVLLVLIPSRWLRPEPGPYKSLSQALRVEGTRIIAERSSPLGRVNVIESPLVPLRYAPGLSLAATTEPPQQLGLFTDGDSPDAITAATRDPARLRFLDESTGALAYHVGRPRTVLVLGAGGGLEVLRAVNLGAARIDAVELNGQLVQLLQETFSDYAGQLFELPQVRVHVTDARGFVVSAHEHYDLIQMSLQGSAGAGAGLGGLTEDYLHTIEAIRLYLTRLNPQGFLSISGWVQLPPRDALKLFDTVVTALTSTGVVDARDRMLMIRSWQTVTLLTKNARLTHEDIARAKAFCAARWFDLAWYPGMRRSEANNYNELPQPWFYDGARALLGADRERFIAEYPFDIRATSDDRPYFQNFFRWLSFEEAWRAKGRGGMALLESGYLVLVATLSQALLAGMVLIVLPLLALRRHPTGRRATSWRVVAYFVSIGLAFLFIEIAFLQKVLLVVHHPTVALALVLATFLIAAGAGSAWAGRILAGAESRKRLLLCVSGIVLLGAIYSVAFDNLMAVVGGLPLVGKALIAAALLAPLAFCMGGPFPLALRELEPSQIPWAWGINGCASVVSAALATLLAVDLGFSTVVWLALGLYAMTIALFPRAKLTPAGC